MKQSPLLIFESDAFAPEAGEDKATNPGIFGKRLAEWLRERLSGSAFTPRDVLAEDFGWLVPVESSPHSLYVACASTDGTGEEWRVFVFAEGGLLARLMGRDRRHESVDALHAALRELLGREPAIRNLREED